jgi:predicted transcriptional regulator
MPAKTRKKLTELEALIMDAVWDLDQATVRQVQERLDAEKPMAYNTVLTMMRILRDKGFLESERDGRSDVYRPIVSREQMGDRSLSDVLERFFSGSVRALVSQLLDSKGVTDEEIKAIRREVNRKLRSENEKGNGNGK